MKVGLSFSAGIDSTTMLAVLRQSGVDVHLIVIDNGLLGEKLKIATKEIANEYGVTYTMVPAPFFRTLQAPAPSVYTPGFRLNLYNLAFSACEAKGLRVLYTGCDYEDSDQLTRWKDVLSESRKQKIDEDSHDIGSRLSQVYAEIYGYKIDVVHGLYLPKANILELGLKLEIPLELTFSCITAYDKREDEWPYRWHHCGMCRGCIARYHAFNAYDSKADRTIYDNDPSKHVATQGNVRIDE